MRRLLVIAGLGLTACGSDSMTTLASGTWGGPNAQLEASGSGATLQFKCGASGTIDQPLNLDGSAHFDVTGTYDPHVVQGAPRAARYVGSVSGSSMTLSVDVEGAALGPYVLRQGQPATFDVCNFGG